MKQLYTYADNSKYNNMNFKEFYTLKEAKVLLPTYNRPNEQKPLKDSDVIRVYHGFNDVRDIFQTLKSGLSGQEKAKRIYSYEYNNNPNGLFVTISLDVAKQFGNYIIEFHTPVSDLESPVWPNGSYTVQGQMSGVFNSPEERENARMRKRDVASKSKYSSIRNSDRPELAEVLFDIHEPQALFVGQLNDNSVRAIWVSETPEKEGSYSTFRRMSVKQFIRENQEKYMSVPQTYTFRVYKPRDKFEIEDFINRLVDKKSGKYNMSRSEIIDALKNLDKRDLLTYVWPNQLDDAWEAISAY